ncbi:MAG: uracil-DNA glycosylase family protein [Chitinophagaceae bacterium]
MATWAERLYRFYKNLQPPGNLPESIEWLYPQQDEKLMSLVKQFFLKFYNDSHSRTLILGINPGRFGAGVTGVNFTASKQLQENCGITSGLKLQTELSADFIYEMIRQYGGVASFYKKFFIGSVCPLGFVKNGKNINYYDEKELAKTVEPFIIKSIKELMQLGFKKNRCFCIGGEKNFRYLSTLNERYHWFAKIIPLPHPRFIMQYRRKQLQTYISQYLLELGQIKSPG